MPDVLAPVSVVTSGLDPRTFLDIDVSGRIRSIRKLLERQNSHTRDALSSPYNLATARTEHRIHFETHLGRDTRDYLRGLELGASVTNEDRLRLIGDEQERLRSVCTVIEFYMCSLMRWRKGWTRYRWFDDIYADRVVVRADQLEFFGEALCAAGQSKFWLEPFFASVTFVENTDRLQSYLFALGDAEIGLRKEPYEARRRMKSRVPSRWLFVLDEKPHIATDN